MPGFVVITEDLPPLKYLIALGLMKLGAPAVVPPSFPFPYGSRVVAETPEEIVDAGSRFPNLRQRYFRSELVQLPHSATPHGSPNGSTRRLYSEAMPAPSSAFGPSTRPGGE